MKKIGIITFHRALNYGAKLQAYALQEVIGEQNEAFVLDYRCTSIENFYYHRLTPKEIAKWILFPRYSFATRKRRKRFLEFDNYFHLTDPYTSQNVSDANRILDLFVAGSDQIWNPAITGNDINYFMNFAEKGKALTYAASFGKASLADWDANIVKDLLKKLNNISLREKTSIDMIMAVDSSLKPYSVLDPVFLLNKETWISKLSIGKKLTKRKYIFVYIVAAQTNTIAKAKAIAKEKDWDILFIDAMRYKDENIINVNDAGPIEFLSLLSSAELVMTTSFHAFAFALIFNKPFLYELSREKANANARLSDLSKILNLENYEIKDSNKAFCGEFDWKVINRRIEQMRNDSKVTLFDSIDKCEV